MKGDVKKIGAKKIGAKKIDVKKISGPWKWGLAASSVIVVFVAALFIGKTLADQKPEFDFVHAKAEVSPSSCTDWPLGPEESCYIISHLNYWDTVRWHYDRLEELGWEGGATGDDVPFSFIYSKEGMKVALHFYPTNVTQDGNIFTTHHDRPGAALLIRRIRDES